MTAFLLKCLRGLVILCSLSLLTGYVWFRQKQANPDIAVAKEAPHLMPGSKFIVADWQDKRASKTPEAPPVEKKTVTYMPSSKSFSGESVVSANDLHTVSETGKKLLHPRTNLTGPLMQPPHVGEPERTPIESTVTIERNPVTLRTTPMPQPDQNLIHPKPVTISLDAERLGSAKSLMPDSTPTATQAPARVHFSSSKSGAVFTPELATPDEISRMLSADFIKQLLAGDKKLLTTPSP